MSYQVGIANEHKPDDPKFGDEESAIACASALAEADFYTPVAVWNLDNYDIEHLFLAGQQFKPA